jgi:ubiquinone biosynthesis protein
MFRSFRDTRRLHHAARVLARHDALVPREYAERAPFPLRIAQYFFGGPRKADADVAPGVRLARALESLGPAYIKLGQMLATRPDLIGEDIAGALEACRIACRRFPRTLRGAQSKRNWAGRSTKCSRSFGEPSPPRPSRRCIAPITAEEEPRSVAVKVLRPGIEWNSRATCPPSRSRRAWPKESPAKRGGCAWWRCRHLAASVALELDLRMEAAAASELAELTASDRDFRVPSVDWPRTAGRVLTTEWIDGTPCAIPKRWPKRVTIPNASRCW